jgi:hypothetical protein
MKYPSRLLLALCTCTLLYCGTAAAARADTVAFSWTIGGSITNPPTGGFLATGSGPVTPFGTAAFTAAGTAGTPVNGVTPVMGQFTFDFGNGNLFQGAFTGDNFPRDAATQLAFFTRSLTITSGTGIFAGASGTATASGNSLLTAGATPPVTFNFSGGGNITAPGLTAVPEPATLLLLGTGLAGVAAQACRHRRAKRPTA